VKILGRFKLLTAIGFASAALLLPATASAYWFYQGNLPTSGGARTVVKFNDCCNSTQWIRLNWSAPFDDHGMIFMHITPGGSWIGYSAFLSDGHDQSSAYSINDYSQGGCNNPAGYSLVYNNCREGNSL
jgi:hypothetical protein